MRRACVSGYRLSLGGAQDEGGALEKRLRVTDKHLGGWKSGYRTAVTLVTDKHLGEQMANVEA